MTTAIASDKGTKKIFRLESKFFRVGPYTAYAMGLIEDKDGVFRKFAEDNGSTHPSPMRDNIPEFETKVPIYAVAFGCKTAKGVEEWFKPVLPMLLAQGFEIISYDVPVQALAEGKKQVVIDITKATNRTVVVPSTEKTETVDKELSTLAIMLSKYYQLGSPEHLLMMTSMMGLGGMLAGNKARASKKRRSSTFSGSSIFSDLNEDEMIEDDLSDFSKI